MWIDSGEGNEEETYQEIIFILGFSAAEMLKMMEYWKEGADKVPMLILWRH